MTEEKDDEFVLCLDRLPSRNSSMSCSSRLYYRSCEGVPFQWEMEPGTPKNNYNPPAPLKEAVPQLISPPPAAFGLGLPPKRVQNKQPSFVLFGPWRKYSNNNNKSKKKLLHSCSSSHKFDDCELIESSSCKQKSNSSSSHHYWRLGCGPWRINTVKIAIGRRV